MSLVFVLAACSHERPEEPPTDRELRDVVRAHGRELDELRAMIGEDAALRVVGIDHVGDCWRISGDWGCNGFHPHDEAEMLAHVGLPRNRWERYRTLFDTIGATAVSVSGSDVNIAMFAAGIVTSGIAKSLVWTSRAPSPIVDDTDRDRPLKFAVRYSIVDAHWYVEETSN